MRRRNSETGGRREEVGRGAAWWTGWQARWRRRQRLRSTRRSTRRSRWWPCIGTIGWAISRRTGRSTVSGSTVGWPEACGTIGRNGNAPTVCAHTWPARYSRTGGQLKQVCRQRLHSGGDSVSLGLLRQHALGFVSVAFALAVLLVSVLHRNLLVHNVLAMHAGNGGVGRLEVAEGDETVALGQVGLVAGNLGGVDQGPETAKGVVERLLVNHGVKVADEELGADLDVALLVGRGLVDTQAAAVEGDIVHELGRIVGLFFGVELDEAEALVLAVDAVDGHVDVADAAGVEHQLVEDARGDALMEVANVDGRLLVLLPVTGAGG